MTSARTVRRALRGRAEAMFASPPLNRLITWRGPRTSRAVALTFDDGPVPGFTDEVLAILARHDARATFFLLGERIARQPEVARRIVAGGHEVGVHGWDHTRRGLPGQIERAAAALGELGVATRLYRPPGGHLDPGTMAWTVRRGWTTVMWSFDTSDSMRHEGKRAGSPDYRAVRGGDIVLMHDDNPVCTADLEQLLPLLAGQGLAPVIASEVMR